MKLKDKNLIRCFILVTLRNVSRSQLDDLALMLDIAPFDVIEQFETELYRIEHLFNFPCDLP
jgi:hypothetical protein